MSVLLIEWMYRRRWGGRGGKGGGPTLAVTPRAHPGAEPATHQLKLILASIPKGMENALAPSTPILNLTNSEDFFATAFCEGESINLNHNPSYSVAGLRFFIMFNVSFL